MRDNMVEFTLEKQKMLMNYLISSPDIYAICSGILKSEYFDPELRSTMDFVNDFYEKYHTIPSKDKILGETEVELKEVPVTSTDMTYACDQVEAFCKRKAFEKAIISAPEKIKKGKYDAVEEAVKEALLISLNREVGLQYFEDPEERIRRMKTSEKPIPTRWSEVDDLLFGGLLRQQMLLLSANSGGGKSIVMANLALNFVEQARVKRRHGRKTI